MNNPLDLSRWRARPLGLVYRIKTMALAGIRRETQTRLFRWLLALGWVGGFCLALAGYLFNRTIAADGLAQQFSELFGVKGRAVFRIFEGFLALYPDICIGGFFNLLFSVYSKAALFLSLLAMTALVPRLIAPDRASNGLTVYLSRPLTSTDYLLGKLGVIAGVLGLLWTAPLIVGWLVGTTLTPSLESATYSFVALKQALLFNAIALVSLSAIALGISALSTQGRTTLLLWIALWLLPGAMTFTGSKSVWLQRASFNRNLREVRLGLFQSESVYASLATHLTLINKDTKTAIQNMGNDARASDFRGALLSLAALSAGSFLVLMRKLRTE
jgi:hypothetical protein